MKFSITAYIKKDDYNVADMITHYFNDFINHLREKGVKYVLTGALASSVWGMIRATSDIDVVVFLSIKNKRAVLDYAEKRKLVTVTNTAYKLVLSDRDRIIDLDIDFAHEPYFKTVIRNAVRKRIGHSLVWVAIPEDIIIGKLISLKFVENYQYRLDIVVLAALNVLNTFYMRNRIALYHLKNEATKVISGQPYHYREVDLSVGLNRLRELL